MKNKRIRPSGLPIFLHHKALWSYKQPEDPINEPPPKKNKKRPFMVLDKWKPTHRETQHINQPPFFDEEWEYETNFYKTTKSNRR